jgi:hypothetical protein
VLLAELLTQRRLKMLEHSHPRCSSSSYAHDDPTHTTRRTEVRLSRFAARARDHGLDLCHCCCGIEVVGLVEKVVVRRCAKLDCVLALLACVSGRGETVLPTRLSQRHVAAQSHLRITRVKRSSSVIHVKSVCIFSTTRRMQ